MTCVVFCDVVGSTALFEKLGDSTASHLITQLNQSLTLRIEQNQGRVVKTLGDGIFAVFAHEQNALSACCQIQQQLHGQPLMLLASDTQPHISSGTFRSLSIQLQIGMESGEVVEIEGDCFGDAVNSAARLADLAGAQQILTSQRVFDALPMHMQAQLRSLGAMYLRGKDQATQVYRIHWAQDSALDADATMLGSSLSIPAALQTLIVSDAKQSHELSLSQRSAPLTMGRSYDNKIMLSDPRVSRQHASISVRSHQFVLTDASSYGTWVYFGSQDKPLILRRTDCILVGDGIICLGCEQDAPDAAVLRFVIR